MRLRLFGLVLMSVLVLAMLAACSGGEGDSENDDTNADATATEEAVENESVTPTSETETTPDAEQTEEPTSMSTDEATQTETSEATATQEPSPEETSTPEVTPTPTPDQSSGSLDPSSLPMPECYESRPEGHNLNLLPAESRSLFQQCQLVAYYGFPGETQMGIAGEYAPEEMITLLKEQVAEYEQYNGFRTAMPAVELIYAVAQGSETADGTYLGRMSNSMVEEWIALAEEHNFMLIFDIQMGSSSVEAEIPNLLPYLTNPRVHLALDPEFVTTPGQVPGQSIGGMSADEINRAQYMLRDLVDEHDLPNKILMVHQFIPEMITNKEQIENVPGIDLVIHQDGFGAVEDKVANYNRYIGAEGAKHGGFKIFYKQDSPVMTVEELMQLTPQIDVVTYQ